jgi:hypothetical protein
MLALVSVSGSERETPAARVPDAKKTGATGIEHQPVILPELRIEMMPICSQFGMQ